MKFQRASSIVKRGRHVGISDLCAPLGRKGLEKRRGKGAAAKTRHVGRGRKGPGSSWSEGAMEVGEGPEHPTVGVGRGGDGRGGGHHWWNKPGLGRLLDTARIQEAVCGERRVMHNGGDGGGVGRPIRRWERRAEGRGWGPSRRRGGRRPPGGGGPGVRLWGCRGRGRSGAGVPRERSLVSGSGINALVHLGRGRRHPTGGGTRGWLRFRPGAGADAGVPRQHSLVSGIGVHALSHLTSPRRRGCRHPPGGGGPRDRRQGRPSAGVPRERALNLSSGVHALIPLGKFLKRSRRRPAGGGGPGVLLKGRPGAGVPRERPLNPGSGAALFDLVGPQRRPTGGSSSGPWVRLQGRRRPRVP